MVTRVIGICGTGDGCGKTTFAECLRFYLTLYGWTADKLSFATPLKQAAAVLFNVAPDYPKNQVLLPWNRRYRDVLRWLGTDVMRNQFDEDFWVRRTMKQIDEDSLPRDVVIIDDVRFSNEVREIQSRRGMVIKVERSVSLESVGPFENNGLNPDLIIDNNGSMDALWTAAEITAYDIIEARKAA
jgi:hypothetical protein